MTENKKSKSLLSDNLRIRKRLQEQELANAKERSLAIEREREIKVARRNAEIYERRERQNKTVSGRIGNFLAKGIGVARRGATRSLYKKSMPMEYKSSPVGYGKVKYGKRGRPFGTVKYRDENGNAIGVYEYRKLLASRLRMQRLQMEQRANISPEQQQIINRIEAQKRYAQSNPEQQIIPDTYGMVDLEGVFSDINKFSNMVD